MELVYTFLAILGLVAIAFVLMSIRILIKKKGQFSSEHVGQSKALKKQGVHCAQTQDKIERKQR